MCKFLPNQTLNFRALFTLVALIFSFQAYAFVDTNCGSISGFEFSNGDSTITINDNQSYFIGDLPNNFYVDLLVDGYSQSAKFDVTNLDTGQCYNITENHLPYTFPGGNCAWNFGCGDFRIKARLYKYDGCGTICDTETINFSITCTQSCGDISGFEFSNGSDTVSIVNDGSYDIDALPDNFYVDLLVDGQSESSSLRLENLNTGDVYNVGENHLPYTIPGGNAAWSYGTGYFKLKAKIFEFDYCQGDPCDVQSIYFTINDNVCGQIDGFEFSNFSDPSVAIVDGGSYDINSIPANFNINVLTSGNIESTFNTLTNIDTGEVYTNLENVVPYTFPGATNEVWNLGCGTFNFCSSVYDQNHANGTECDTQCITFTITNCCGTIDGFEFSNFSDPSVAIVDGGSYDINAIPSDFNINVLTSGNVESAFNTLTNLDTGEVYTKLENVIPYTFPGATNQVWNLGCGTFNFCSTVYEENNASGTECDTQCITFTITNCCGTIDEFVFTNGTEDVSIVDGSTYDLSELPLDSYINSIVSGTADSVMYTITNTDTNISSLLTDNSMPYTYPAGETSWDLGIGNFMITAQLYTVSTTGDCDNSTDRVANNNTTNSKSATSNNCLQLCEVQTISFTLTDGVACQPVSAGTGSLAASVVLVDPNVDFFVTVTPNGDASIPQGYQLGTVVTSGNALTIQQVSSTTTIQLPAVGGNYKIHMLAYNPSTLDLNDISLGVTTASDVLNLINNGQVCADLDTVGVSILVILSGSTDKVANNSRTSNTSNSDDVTLVSDIKLYPNPVVNELNVDITLLEGEVLNYTMIDLNGKQVLSGSLTSNRNIIKTKELAGGLYILKLKSEGRSFTKKILVNK
ncbi:T9SS type A sorting domain-containing protein [Olleya sp. YS]|uniref:T9SS type A sorting domain-containing protein n=1 Tax=Olleya sp. YS TaxID=3028318 RepID=UPI0024342ABA|nr:T9SS type A sorting domain-containing protein [Olleya sp. YS]WGD35197.1 T9SS type A sorting domain-containing protein [Olleya sp. YS]